MCRLFQSRSLAPFVKVIVQILHQLDPPGLHLHPPCHLPHHPQLQNLQRNQVALLTRKCHEVHLNISFVTLCLPYQLMLSHPKPEGFLGAKSHVPTHTELSSCPHVQWKLAKRVCFKDKEYTYGGLSLSNSPKEKQVNFYLRMGCCIFISAMTVNDNCLHLMSDAVESP